MAEPNNGRCAEHKQPAHGWGRSEDRGSSHERGYGAEWRRRRERILRRDFGLCQPCKRNGSISIAGEVDHIIPKARGGSEDDDNMQSICVDCHKAKTLRERNEQ